VNRCVAAIAIAALLVSCGGGENPEGPTADGFDADRAFRDLEAQVAIGPRPAGSVGSRAVVRLIAARLRAAGVEDVAVQRPHRNVVARIPGSDPGAIVLGAHHDTKDDVPPPFAGANDGASGVAVVLELARVLAGEAPLDGPSVHLAFFDAEEARGDRDFAADGLRGSRQYVELAAAGGREGSPPLERIEAMVLFDLVGDCDLQIPREANSDPGLYAEFEGEPFGGETSGVTDDHIPFILAGVPALDVIDFTYGPGAPPGAYWHTSEDTLDKVCPESLDAVGEAALRALPRLP
jgi:Iap family predicted aminopeptidase